MIRTSVGYAGGTLEAPSYDAVCTGTTGHTEVVEVEYDPDRVSLQEILEAFWSLHDPTRVRKDQYRSVIFWTTPEQRPIAEASKAAVQASGRFPHPVLTSIEPAPRYWRAEEHHQRYYQKRGLKGVR